jgi:hypothetical protein
MAEKSGKTPRLSPISFGSVVFRRAKRDASISLSMKFGNQSRVVEFIEVAESLSIIGLPAPWRRRLPP